MTSLSDIVQPARYIAEMIKQKLEQGDSVLWLVSGGSAKSVAVAAREYIGDIPDGATLNVCLIDERFGPVGHEDSNLKQLMDVGFKTNGLVLHPVLSNSNLVETTVAYNELLEKLLSASTFRIALLGVGTDGHTAGILPGSKPLNEKSKIITHYKGPDYERITATPRIFSLIDEAVVYARGADKFQAVKLFLSEDALETDVPAVLIKKAKHYKLFSDYKELRV